MDLKELKDVSLDLRAVKVDHISLQLVKEILKLLCLVTVSVPSIDIVLKDNWLFRSQCTDQIHLYLDHVVFERAELAQR